MWKKVHFIVTTDKGDSVGFSTYVRDDMSDREIWMLGIIRAYDYVRKVDHVTCIEWEREEEV